MSRKIVVVSFKMSCEEDGTHFTRSTSMGAQEYEYLAPEGATGEEKYAVVVCTKDGKIRDSGSLKVVRVLAFRELVNQEYDGELKSVVALVDTSAYLKSEDVRVQKRKLLAQIEKKISERSKLSQLEALADDDEEAKALLAAFKAL